MSSIQPTIMYAMFYFMYASLSMSCMYDFVATNFMWIFYFSIILCGPNSLVVMDSWRLISGINMEN